MHRTVAFLVLALPLAIACGDEPVQRVAPRIEVVDTEGELATSVKFPVLPIRDEAEGALVVRSLTSAALEVKGIEIEGVGADQFALDEESFTVPGKGTREFTIRFRPMVVGDHEATLRIHSSDPRTPTVEVAIEGTSIDSAIEVIGCVANTNDDPERCQRTAVIAPETVDLGDVVEGTATAAMVTISNLGKKPLDLTSVSFDDPQRAFEAGFTLPKAIQTQTIGGGSNVAMRIGFHPPRGLIEELEVALILESSDFTHPEVRLPIKANVTPNATPLVCLKVLEVRPFGGKSFEPKNEDEAIISPGDQIVISARAREGCTFDEEDGEDLTLRWAIAGMDEGTEDLPFELKSEGDPFEMVFQPDMIGTYLITLEAEDSSEQVSSEDDQGNPAELILKVEPREDIGVEIRWPGFQNVDIDLHLVRTEDHISGMERLFSDHDFFGLNQDVTWGANPPFSNPRLAVDDLGSRMVETTLLNQPEEGKVYSIFAHMWRDARPGRSTAPGCSSNSECGENVCSFTNEAQGVCVPPVVVSARLFLLREEVEMLAIPYIPTAKLGSPCDIWWIGDVVWGDPPVFIPGSHSTWREGQGIKNATCEP